MRPGRREGGAPGGRPRRPTEHSGRTALGPQGGRLHAGRARTSAVRPAARRSGGRGPRRHPQPRRRLLDQPRRVDQQDRRLVAGRTPRLVRRRRRTPAQVDRGRAGPAHRTRHRRGQPRRARRRARRDVEPVGAAAHPHRDALRPVRLAGPRAVVVRHLRRRPVDPRRHPLGRHPRPRRRCAPVDHDPSIGLEQPGCIAWEPAFAQDLEWCLLAAMDRIGRPDGTSAYLRLSTRPVEQSLARLPEDPVLRERRRAQVVAGGYPPGTRRAPSR